RLAGEFSLIVEGYLDALLALEQQTQAGRAAGGSHDAWGARFDATPDVWWPERGDISTGTEPVELWLRRAGYPYRHTVSVGLPGHLEALIDGLRMVMHALETLPPGGILSRTSLHLGLATLSSDLAGDLVPHHIQDIDPRHVGLLT